jgi:RHS repeat-associated protein
VRNVVDYFPSGKILRIYSQGEVERYLTTGNERDVETGYDHRNKRVSDCETVRFLSIDPLADKFPEWSPYVYVEDNPAIKTDPNGDCPTCLSKFIMYVNALRIDNQKSFNDAGLTLKEVKQIAPKSQGKDVLSFEAKITQSIKILDKEMGSISIGGGMVVNSGKGTALKVSGKVEGDYLGSIKGESRIYHDNLNKSYVENTLDIEAKSTSNTTFESNDFIINSPFGPINISELGRVTNDAYNQIKEYIKTDVNMDLNPQQNYITPK